MLIKIMDFSGRGFARGTRGLFGFAKANPVRNLFELIVI